MLMAHQFQSDVRRGDIHCCPWIWMTTRLRHVRKSQAPSYGSQRGKKEKQRAIYKGKQSTTPPGFDHPKYSSVSKKNIKINICSPTRPKKYNCPISYANGKCIFRGCFPPWFSPLLCPPSNIDVFSIIKTGESYVIPKCSIGKNFIFNFTYTVSISVYITLFF